MTNFEKPRYFELLEKEKRFNRNNRSSFFSEYKEEFKEMVKYDSMVLNQFYYNQKEDYRLLIEDYLSGKISDGAFVWRFFEMYKQDAKNFEILTKDFQKLLSFQIESRSEGFSDHMDHIFGNCKSLGVDPDNIDSYECDESQFKEYLEIIYSKMQKYFDK